MSVRDPIRTARKHMLLRCYNAGHPLFADYGGRGITVCARWRGSLKAFREDLSPRPDGTSLDRIDNNGGYWCGHCEECVADGRPANCRWASAKQQAQNTRANRWLPYQGRLVCLREWARLIGAYPSLLSHRLRLGWSLEEAINTPVKAHFKQSKLRARKAA